MGMMEEYPKTARFKARLAKEKADELRERRSELPDTLGSLCDRLDLLLDQWKRRLRSAEKLLNDAAGAHDWNAAARLKGKVGMIRSMIVELEREIRNP